LLLLLLLLLLTFVAQGTLSTTGHSTNFILTIELPTERAGSSESSEQTFLNNLGHPDSAKWIKAGVAAVCSLRY
jgi:hypothetical protein